MCCIEMTQMLMAYRESSPFTVAKSVFHRCPCEALLWQPVDIVRAVFCMNWSLCRLGGEVLEAE